MEQTKDITSDRASSCMSVCITGSLEFGQFDGYNDVYAKISILAGPDWTMTSGNDFRVTQISRYTVDVYGRKRFVWNQPISISYKTNDIYGWPQLVISIYYFDSFGNDQLLGYGSIHLAQQVSGWHIQPIKQIARIYAPQSSTFVKQILSWITGKKPELVDSSTFARGDCRRALQVTLVGYVEFTLNLTTKDFATNGYQFG